MPKSHTTGPKAVVSLAGRVRDSGVRTIRAPSSKGGG